VTDGTGSIVHVEARTHGRVLVRTPRVPPPWPLLVGFHGYAETAEGHLAAIERIAGVDAWLVAAVQALHPFYTRQQAIVANWMTSQDRELAIADNIDYVGGCLLACGTNMPSTARSCSRGSRKAARWPIAPRLDTPARA
jgi:hypothetical protein